MTVKDINDLTKCVRNGSSRSSCLFTVHFEPDIHMGVHTFTSQHIITKFSSVCNGVKNLYLKNEY